MPKQASLSPAISRLYARYLTSDEKKSLRLVPADDVSSEINLLRMLTALFMKIQQSAPKDLSSCMQALRTCTLLCEQLAILVHFHDKEHSPLSEWNDALDEALSEVPFFLDDRVD